MDPTDIGMFRLAEQRLAWVDRRQRLLAQNVANANTPGFVARDLAPFAAAMAGGTLAQTSARHLPGPGASGAEALTRPQARSPNGNAVSIEEQLGQVADTAGIQELAINLHRRYQTMVRTALGRGS